MKKNVGKIVFLILYSFNQYFFITVWKSKENYDPLNIASPILHEYQEIVQFGLYQKIFSKTCLDTFSNLLIQGVNKKVSIDSFRLIPCRLLNSNGVVSGTRNFKYFALEIFAATAS